jgi:large subunit ribosomal protein L28
MAKCEKCGKIPMFGNRRSHSLRASRREFKPNIQRVSVFENGQRLRKHLCAKCIKSLSKLT